MTICTVAMTIYSCNCMTAPVLELYTDIRTAPGLGEGVMPLYWTHLVWDCSTVAFCMYFPLENTSSTDVMLYAHTAERPMFPLKREREENKR